MEGNTELKSWRRWEDKDGEVIMKEHGNQVMNQGGQTPLGSPRPPGGDALISQKP